MKTGYEVPMDEPAQHECREAETCIICQAPCCAGCAEPETTDGTTAWVCGECEAQWEDIPW